MNDDELRNKLHERATEPGTDPTADEVFASAQSQLTAKGTVPAAQAEVSTITPVTSETSRSPLGPTWGPRLLAAVAAAVLLVAGGVFLASRDTNGNQEEIAVGDGSDDETDPDGSDGGVDGDSDGGVEVDSDDGSNDGTDEPNLTPVFDSPFPECGDLWQSGQPAIEPVADEAVLLALRERLQGELMTDPSNEIFSMGGPENVYGRITVGMQRNPQTLAKILTIVDEPQFGDLNLVCLELPPADFDDGPEVAVWSIAPSNGPIAENWQNLVLLVDDPHNDCGHNPAGRIQEPTVTYTETEVIIEILLDGVPFGPATCEGWEPVEVTVSLPEDPAGRPIVSSVPGQHTGPVDEPQLVEPEQEVPAVLEPEEPPGLEVEDDAFPADSEDGVEFAILVGRTDSPDPCQPELVPVTRVGADDSLSTRLLALLEGVEDDPSVNSPFRSNTAGRLNTAVVEDGLARVDFDDLLGAPDGFNNTSCGSGNFFRILDANVLAFPGVDNVIYSDSGSQLRFYGAFEGEPPPDPATWAIPEWLGTVVDRRDRSTGEGFRRTLRASADGFGSPFVVGATPGREIIMSADATLDANDPIAVGALDSVGELSGLNPPPESGLSADPTVDEWFAYLGSSDAVRWAEVAVIDRAQDSRFADDPVYEAIYQRWPDAVTNTWIGPRQEDGDAEAFIEVFTVMQFGVDVHALLFDPLGDAHTVVPVAAQ